MRKLILLTQVSIDGYMASTDGKTDWMVWNWGEEWNWDEKLQQLQQQIHSKVDTVLISRQMAEEGFVEHWQSFAQKTDNPQHGFAQAITNANKIVFTNTLSDSIWPNTVLSKGDLETEVNKLKNGTGKDMIAYGGSTFISLLIASGLIDEYYLLVNPTAIGKGLPVFKNRVPLQLMSATSYDCGIVVLKYKK